MAGIPDPLRSLPDMHAVLDVVEVLLTENMTADERDSYYRRTYVETRVVATDPVPAGFSVADQQNAFKAFAAFAGGVE